MTHQTDDPFAEIAASATGSIGLNGNPRDRHRNSHSALALAIPSDFLSIVAPLFSGGPAAGSLNMWFERRRPLQSGRVSL